MDPSLLTTCRGMLMQATQLGERPLAYIMNPATQQHMTDLAAVEAMPKQSAFQRVLFRARKKHLILQVFCGVPILQNQFMPDGFVSLQFIPRGPQMQQGAAMPAGAPSVQAQANSAPGEWPFAKKEELRIQEAPAEELEEACYMMGGGQPDGMCPEISGWPAAHRGAGICGNSRKRKRRRLWTIFRGAPADSPSVTDVLIKAVENARCHQACRGVEDSQQ